MCICCCSGSTSSNKRALPRTFVRVKAVENHLLIPWHSMLVFACTPNIFCVAYYIFHFDFFDFMSYSCRGFAKDVIGVWQPGGVLLLFEFEGVRGARSSEHIWHPSKIHVSVRHFLDYRKHELDDVGQVHRMASSLAFCRHCFFQSEFWYCRTGLRKSDPLTFYCCMSSPVVPATPSVDPSRARTSYDVLGPLLLVSSPRCVRQSVTSMVVWR